MASIKYYPNGAGGTVGADLAIAKPLYTSGVIWYVCNASAAASNANVGTDRDLPLLTLQQAVTNAGPGDIIDLLARHREVIATTVTLSDEGVSIVGEGVGSVVPKLISNVPAGSGPMIAVEDKGIFFDNIYFPASLQTARERIFIGGSPTGVATLKNLSFECSAFDSNRTVWFDSVGPSVITGCTFTATGVDAGPGVQLTAESGFTMDSCVFDAGSFNWGTDGAFLQSSSPSTSMRITNISLLNGSNMYLTATGAVGVIGVTDQSGDSVIDWTP